jgi:predicted transcriptional regulator
MFLHNKLCSLGALSLLTPCEIAVKSVIPAIRAAIAKELIQTHKMKQTEVANLLGITQTAVSKYVGNVRGRAIKIDGTEAIRNMVNEVAFGVTNGDISGSQLVLELCKVCKAVRQDRLMCQLCEATDQTLNIKRCTICMTGACITNI